MSAMDKYQSRFITTNDIREDEFVFKIGKNWWSRPYEYAWAAEFVEPDDVALDAACGVIHPLKFYLAQKCSEVYACDLDGAINAPEEI